MKQILMLIDSHQFRDYLRLKLQKNGVEVSVASFSHDCAAKMRRIVPDLMILDYQEDNVAFMELFRQKKADPNTVNTPVIILAQKLGQKQLLEMVPYNVKRVFTKPIKIDALFGTITELLGIPFSIDESPGILEVHVNEKIIFIRIAQGLNSDKLDLLRLKLSELITLYKIRLPKIIVLFSDIKLALSDAPNIHKLFNAVLEAAKAKLDNVRILTNDDFIHQYVNEHYSGIKVVSDLLSAIDDLTHLIDKDNQYDGAKAHRIEEKILAAGNQEEDEEHPALKFDAEDKKRREEIFKTAVKNLRIAVVDDDFVIQEMIKNIFKMTDSSVFAYSDGSEFLKTVDSSEYDLVFLDLNMPNVDGFGVLEALQGKNIPYPIIAFSTINQRGIIIKVIQLGVKSYLVKPLRPEDIFIKALEIFKANF